MLTKLLRGALIAVLTLILVGSGLCGLFGTVAGIGDLGKPSRGGGEDFHGVVLFFGLAGLGVAAVSGLILYFLVRKSRTAKPIDLR